MKIFIVNLKHDIINKLYLKNLCSKFNLQPKFIEAVEGAKLSKKEIENIYKKEKAKKTIGRELTKGEIGCLLSHRLIYKEILEKHIEYSLILEDDVIFDDSLNEILSRINLFPNKWEVLLLGHHAGESREIPTRYNIWYKKKLSEEIIIRKPAEKAYGTYGYIVNFKGAYKLYETTKNFFMPIDHYTGDNKYTNLYIIQDPIVHINKKMEKLSNLDKERKDAKKQLIISSGQNKHNILKTILIKVHLYYALSKFKKGLNIFFNKIKPVRRYR